MANTAINQHFQRLIRLLELEAEAEKQEALRDMQRRSPAAAAVYNHLLQDLPSLAANDLTRTPVDLIDTAGASYDESAELKDDSRYNLQEADLVLKKVQALLASGLAPTDIAIISPYSAQVRLLRERIQQPEMEIDSVDGFQGREKEAVIVLLVRSNRDDELNDEWADTPTYLRPRQPEHLFL